ncbi:hypothetical protein ACIRNI_02980 [Streptomyces sp. NPDC093546]|uniref:hypothetical protein n=1 Tax=Streptomyces sp. NPDC093546 TaxID=3366040 RepID=UPI00382B7494
MSGLIAFLATFAVLFLAAAVVDLPRRLWWRFRAPHFDNPEAHEPPDAAFRWRRIGLVVLAGAFVWQVVVLLRAAGAFDSGPDHAETLKRVRYAAANLATDEGQGRSKGLGNSWDEFIDLRLRGPGDDPSVRLVKKDGDVEKYEVAGICLTVTATPLPGQSEVTHAVGVNLLYSIKTDVQDSPCK